MRPGVLMDIIQWITLVIFLILAGEIGALTVLLLLYWKVKKPNGR